MNICRARFHCREIPEKKDSFFLLGMEELMKEKLSLEEELNALKSDSVSTKFVLVS